MEIIKRIFAKALAKTWAIPDPIPGEVWCTRSDNPFDSYTVTVADVKQGYVKYSFGPTANSSLSLETFKRTYRRKSK